MFFETVTSLFDVDCVLAASVDELIANPTALDSDLAILDVNLGAEKDGIDAHEWLREHSYRGKVVFLTGHAASHPLTRRAAELGRARVFEKPLSISTLSGIIDEVRT
jgi:DNA-binding NarL/FixJ family response regulator